MAHKESPVSQYHQSPAMYALRTHFFFIKITVLNQFFKNDKSKLEENSEDSEIHCYSYY